MSKQAGWLFATVAAPTLCFGLLSLLSSGSALGTVSIFDLSWEAPPERVAQQMKKFGFEERYGSSWRGVVFGLSDTQLYPEYRDDLHRQGLLGFNVLIPYSRLSDYAIYQKIRIYLDAHYKTFKLLKTQETALKTTESATVDAVYRGKPLNRFYSSKSGTMIMLSFTRADIYQTGLDGVLLKGCGTRTILYISAPSHDVRTLPDQQCTPLGPNEFPL